MTNEKHTTKDAWRTPFNPPADTDTAARKVPPQPVKVVAFEIEDHDVGGDPYNHTGSFCVPDFEE